MEQPGTDMMTLLLNKAEAVLDCGAGTLKDLSRHIGKRPAQVADWVRDRRYTPSGDVAMAIFGWVSERTIAISMAGRKIQNAYSNELNRIMHKWPVRKQED